MREDSMRRVDNLDDECEKLNWEVALGNGDKPDK